jgi:predicted lipoprotein with Yx(FWY)xxD motif
VVAGCGGNGTASTVPPANASGQTATVSVANEGNLGKILVNRAGRTLYLFQKDSGSTSACTGACAAAWPPLRSSGRLTAGAGLRGDELGMSSRSDGKPQVTYNGRPLYLFSGDNKAGDTNGEGSTAFGAGWFALTAAGNKVAGSPSSSGGSSGY